MFWFTSIAMVSGMDSLNLLDSQLFVCFSDNCAYLSHPPFPYANPSPPSPPPSFPLSEARKRGFITMARKQPAPTLPLCAAVFVVIIIMLNNCCCFCLCTVVNGSLLRSPFARQEMQGFIESYINETYCKWNFIPLTDRGFWGDGRGEEISIWGAISP